MGGSYEQLGYDASSNVTSRRKRDGRTISYAYDALDRLTSVTYPDGGARPVYYNYDLRGLLTAARYDSPTGSDAVSNSWDALGREITTTTVMGGVSRTVGSQYDAAGDLTRSTQPDGAYFQYNRDALGRIDTILANGTANLIRYQYDDLGRRQSVDRFLSNGTWGASTTYSYDAVGRLGGMSITTTTNPVSYGFSYNPAGQLSSQTVSNDAYAFNGFTNVDRNYIANGLNQYTTAGPASFTYDANGNLTSDGTTGFSYDLENRMVSTSTGWALTYDPLGRLYQQVQNGNGTQSIYAGDRIVAEYNPAGGAQYSRYVHGDGDDEPLATLSGAGLAVVQYAYADRQGSIIGYGDGSGAIAQPNQYDEYGIRTNAQGRFQYTGQNWLPLGLYYYKARMYSQTLGRFMQTDPIGYGDGLNWYNYVGSDPVNKSDPSGLVCGVNSDPTLQPQPGDTATVTGICDAWPDPFDWQLYTPFRLIEDRDRDLAQMAKDLSRMSNNSIRSDLPQNSNRCGGDERVTISPLGFGATGFLGIIGGSVGFEPGIAIPIDSIRNGNFSGMQLYASGNATILGGIGLFGGFGPTSSVGYSSSIIRDGWSDPQFVGQAGIARGPGAEVTYPEPESSNSGSISFGAKQGMGLYSAVGAKFSYTFLSSGPLFCR